MGSTRKSKLDSSHQAVSILGRVGAPFGVKGALHVHLHGDSEILSGVKVWLLAKNKIKPNNSASNAKPNTKNHHDSSNSNYSSDSNSDSHFSWQPYEVLSLKQQGKGWVAQFKNIDNRDLAASLTNSEIGIFREELPELPAGEYYWSQLIGLEVVNEDGVFLGRVESLFETGSNDVLVVKHPETLKEHWLPYLPGEYLITIDLKTGRIEARWDPDF